MTGLNGRPSTTTRSVRDGFHNARQKGTVVAKCYPADGLSHSKALSGNRRREHAYRLARGQASLPCHGRPSWAALTGARLPVVDPPACSRRSSRRACFPEADRSAWPLVAGRRPSPARTGPSVDRRIAVAQFGCFPGLGMLSPADPRDYGGRDGGRAPTDPLLRLDRGSALRQRWVRQGRDAGTRFSSGSTRSAKRGDNQAASVQVSGVGTQAALWSRLPCVDRRHHRLKPEGALPHFCPTSNENGARGRRMSLIFQGFLGGRCRVRTCDPCRVKAVLYR
jgi:hypothetical protein